MKINHRNWGLKAEISGVDAPMVTADNAPQPPSAEIIFGTEGGYVFASWLGAQGSMRLGTYEAIKAAMSDFLAQCTLGERLVSLCDNTDPS
jgi:hypothetical protein